MSAESDQQLLENRLFIHLKGWLRAEGYDIQNGVEHRWACKSCVSLNRGLITSFKATGLQNARSHRIRAPGSEKMCEAQMRDIGIAEKIIRETGITNLRLAVQLTQPMQAAVMFTNHKWDVEPDDGKTLY